jgi:hypothetical protein
MFLAIPVGIYLGDIVWLCVWRFFATRDELSKVVFAGMTSRFDRWLFNALAPADTPPSEEKNNNTDSQNHGQ